MRVNIIAINCTDNMAFEARLKDIHQTKDSSLRLNAKVLETWINETLHDAEHLDIPGVVLKPEHKNPISRYSIDRLSLTVRIMITSWNRMLVSQVTKSTEFTEVCSFTASAFMKCFNAVCTMRLTSTSFSPRYGECFQSCWNTAASQTIKCSFLSWTRNTRR